MTRNPLTSNTAAQSEAIRERTSAVFEDFEFLIGMGEPTSRAIKRVGYKSASSLDKLYRWRKRETPQALKDEKTWQRYNQ